MVDQATLNYRRLKAGFYLSGFRVGDKIKRVGGLRKYNTLITIDIGTTGIVDEPTNFDGWPDDAVQVDMPEVGCGALDARILVHDDDYRCLLPPQDNTLMLVKFKVFGSNSQDVYIDPHSVESISLEHFAKGDIATRIHLTSSRSWWVCGSVDEVAHLIDLEKNRTVNETSPK